MHYQQRFIGQGTHGYKHRLRRACTRHGARVIVVKQKAAWASSARDIAEALGSAFYVLAKAQVTSVPSPAHEE
jgi:hypothetical protein